MTWALVGQLSVIAIVGTFCVLMVVTVVRSGKKPDPMERGPIEAPKWEMGPRS